MCSGRALVFLCLTLLFSGCTGDDSNASNRMQPFFLGRMAFEGASGFVIADFNEDSLPDMAITIGENDSVQLYEGMGKGWFVPGAQLNAQINPYALAAGDFNGDGHIDLVCSNYWSFSISVFLGDGTGNFNEPNNYGPNSQVAKIEVRDFNNDKILDFMTLNFGTSDLSLFIGDGLGGFTSHIALSGFGSAPEFCLADFNNDGSVDVAVIQYKKVLLFYNDGHGSFGEPFKLQVMDGIGVAVSVDAGDFNRDGFPDVVVGVQYSDIIDFVVILSQADGTFNPAVPYKALGDEVVDGYVDDINGDGMLDIAFSTICTPPPGRIEVYFGNGRGDFTVGPLSVGVDGTPGELTITDVNGDNIGDLIFQDQSPSTITTNISFGLGDGSYLSEKVLPRMGGHYNCPVVADLNFDGYPDIVVLDSILDECKIIVYPGPTYSDPIISTIGKDYGLLRLKDLNHDGILDAVVGSGDIPLFGIAVCLGHSDMTFTFFDDPQVDLGEICQPLDMLIDDFDGDGNDDLVASCGSIDLVAIFSGDGDGHLLKVSEISVLDPYGLSTGQYDSDQRLDVAIGSGGSDSLISIYTGIDNPGVSFQFKSQLNLNGDYTPISMKSKDITQDGFLDLIWTDGEYIFTAAGQGEGFFSSDYKITRIGNTHYDVHLFDINRDGLDDIALANISGLVTTMIGNGDGTFREMVTYYAEKNPQTLAVHDLNGDGLEDIVVGNLRYLTILYASQAKPQTSPAITIIGLVCLFVLLSTTIIYKTQKKSHSSRTIRINEARVDILECQM